MNFPVICEVHSHQEFHRAWLWALGQDIHGPYALLVYEGGEVKVLYLNSVHRIKIVEYLGTL